MDTKAIIFIIFLFHLINLSSQSVTLECDLNTKWSYQIVGSIYRCEVKNNLNITSADEAIVDGFTGKHLAGYSLNNLCGFDVRNKVVKYFPQEIKKIFPYINLILINDCELKELHQEDINPFPNLKVLDLQGNDISILEDGVFDLNINLQYIGLLRNRILHVDINVFSKLTSLSKLSFYKNKCLDKDSAYDSTSVKNLIAEINTNCNSNYYLELNKILKGLQKDLKTIKVDSFVGYSKRLDELESNFKNSNFSYFTTFEKRIEDIKNDQKFAYIQIDFNLKKRIDDFEVAEQINNTVLGRKIDALENKLENFIKTIDKKVKLWELLQRKQ